VRQRVHEATVRGNRDNEEQTGAIYDTGEGNISKVNIWIDSPDAIEYGYLGG